MHPWIGAGPEDQRHILSELGLQSIDDLFASIPAAVCVEGLELPPARDEDWIRRAFGEMAAPLSILGNAFIRLFQMTVIPYVAVSLITAIGSLNYRDAKELALKALLLDPFVHNLRRAKSLLDDILTYNKKYETMF